MKRTRFKYSGRMAAFLLALVMTVSIAFTGCSNKNKPDNPASAPSTQERENSVKLKDDFYAAVNEEVLKKHDPEKAGSWNWFYDLDDKAKNECYEIIREAAKNAEKGNAKEKDSVYKLGMLYLMAMDQEGRNQDGVKYFNDLMKPVMEAATVQDFMNGLAELQYKYGFDSLLNLEVLALDENPGEYSVLLKDMDYGVASEEFEYEDAEEENKYYFTDYLGKFLIYSGSSESDSKRDSEKVYEFVKAVATSKTADKSAKYQPVSVDEIQKLLSGIDLKQYLGKIFHTAPTELQIIDTAPLQSLNIYLKDENLPMLKSYVYMINLQKYSAYMTSDMTDINREMEEGYYGETEKFDAEKLAAKQVADLLKWDVGKLYTEMKFDSKKKDGVQKIVNMLLDEYKEMLKEEDWLSQETRQKALEKLGQINLRLGCPEDISRYLSAWKPIARKDGGSYLSNVLELRKEITQKQYDLFGTPVDRTVWKVLPQELVPCYYPTDNSIYLPVAALEEPYFSAGASEEENLGAIGMIIGHEITHAFDDLGSKYDGKGDYVDWWTKADRKEFDARAKKIATFYNEYKTPGIMQQDGEYTLGENIADLGAMSCLSRIIEKKGLSAEKFFESYANAWASTSDGMTQALVSGMDEHAEDKVRVNAVLACCELFYKTYGVKEGDGMYIKPENRVALW